MILIAQLAFWASGVLVEQVVLLIANSVLPVEGALVNIRLPNPVFVTVTAWALLVVPTGCGVAKLRVVVGFKTTVGEVPVPVSATVCVWEAGVLVPLL